MALGMTCIPTIREEVARLQQADVVDELEVRRLVREAAGSVRKPISDPEAAPRRRPSLRYRLLHPVHGH